MNKQAWLGKTETAESRYGSTRRLLCAVLFIWAVSGSSNLMAQETQPAAQDARLPDQALTEGSAVADESLDPANAEALETPEISVTLPDSHQMALALANPGSRQQAMLDLAVAANTINRAQGKGELEQDHAALAQGFMDDRAWLQMLVERYGWVPPRTSVLDPAAWLVLEELQQHDHDDMSRVFPGRTPRPVLIQQVFQRAAERLAAASLPILLLKIEIDAINLWDEFLQVTGIEGEHDAAWKTVETAWFTDRQFPEAEVTEAEVTEEAPQTHDAVMADIPQAMSRLVMGAVQVGPPDSRALVDLRSTLLHDVPALTAEQNIHAWDQARDSLYFINLVDGLHEDRYFDFIQGLLSITSRLLEQPVSNEDGFSLVDVLLAELPAISAYYAVDFARVDPRLNGAMAAVYGVLQKIAAFEAIDPEASLVSDPLASADGASADSASADGSSAGNATAADLVSDTVPVDEAETEQAQDGDGVITDDVIAGDAIAADVRPGPVAVIPNNAEIKASRRILADAVAQLALLIPDMAYYFDTPVRRRIVEEINICISISLSSDATGGAALKRRQFDGCMETLLQLAEQETRSAELSGNMNGPFTTDTLRRELNVTPWQRINYGIGYLHDKYPTSCQPPAGPLPNPLEWAVLATTMAWFAGNSPEFIDTPENESRLTRMRGIGEQLAIAMAEQAGCLMTADAGVKDPVSRGLTDYELALRELDQGIEQAEIDFRTERLKPAADVLLDQDALQKTGYRPEGLLIGPCDERDICEMSGRLSTTRALIGLFPDEYLLAEQSGLGEIEICYRNMEWVERRSKLVRADDENVANYFAKLGFDLVGRYTEKDKTTDIFGFRFTSPQEHHYLFAQSSDDVLNDSCPVEWVGSRVVTPLREDRGGIVPNRLTYLAASRKLPSRLLQQNWDKGAEWRDWFVTGIGVVPLELEPVADIKPTLNLHLQSLYQAEQAGIYQRVLLPNARNAEGDDVSLYDEMMEVSVAKSLIRMQMMLFYPDSLSNSDEIRTAIAGDSGLVEGRTIRRFREDGVALTSVNQIALDRLDQLRKVWIAQPEAVRRQGSLPGSLMHAWTRINTLYRDVFVLRPDPLQEVEVLAKPQELEQQPVEGS